MTNKISILLASLIFLGGGKAFAAVTPIQDYTPNLKSAPEAAFSCLKSFGSDWNSSAISNASCSQQKLPDGTLCYKCTCDNTEFSLETCPTQGICSSCKDKFRLDNCNSGYIINTTKTACVADCKDYPISGNCPTGGSCTPCPNDSSKKKLNSCDTSKGWKQSGNTCEAETCKAGKAGVTSSSCTSTSPNYITYGYSGGQVCGMCTCSNIDSNCTAANYHISSGAPTNAYFVSCNTGCGSEKVTRWEITSCHSDYKLSGNTCVFKECTDYGYQASRPANKTCTTQTPRNGLTCYADCKECDSGYILVEGTCKKCEEGYVVANGVCVKEGPKTCEEWVKENFPAYKTYTGTESSIGTGYTAVLASGTTRITTTGTVNLVGPKYFNSELCQNTNTPTLTISNPTKSLVNANYVNLFFNITKADLVDSSCKNAYEYCSTDSNTFSSCMQSSAANPSRCYSGATADQCCTLLAAISPNVTSGTMTVDNAEIKATSGVFYLGNNQTVNVKNTSSLASTCTVKTDYGCRVFFGQGFGKKSVNIDFAADSTTKISGTIYIFDSSSMTVNKNATVNISNSGSEAGLFVNQSGYTPTYFAENGVHNYGTIITDSTGFHAGQINNYSGSAFSTVKITSNSSYPGRIKNEANAKVKIGGTCKIPGSGEYKFTANSTSTNPFSGSSCSM